MGLDNVKRPAPRRIRRYINWRGPMGRETVDEIEGTPREVRDLVAEYGLAFGSPVYASRRPCGNWSDSNG